MDGKKPENMDPKHFDAEVNSYDVGTAFPPEQVTMLKMSWSAHSRCGGGRRT